MTMNWTGRSNWSVEMKNHIGSEKMKSVDNDEPRGERSNSSTGPGHRGVESEMLWGIEVTVRELIKFCMKNQKNEVEIHLNKETNGLPINTAWICSSCYTLVE